MRRNAADRGSNDLCGTHRSFLEYGPITQHITLHACLAPRGRQLDRDAMAASPSPRPLGGHSIQPVLHLFVGGLGTVSLSPTGRLLGLLRIRGRFEGRGFRHLRVVCPAATTNERGETYDKRLQADRCKAKSIHGARVPPSVDDLSGNCRTVPRRAERDSAVCRFTADNDRRT
jgi:hypothetical protein